MVCKACNHPAVEIYKHKGTTKRKVSALYFFGESCDCMVFMLPDTSGQIARYSEIKNTIAFASLM